MTDGDAASAYPWPASILLAQQTYVAASRNDTTATAKGRSTGNHTVEVTFRIADPRAVSFCTFHCSKDADLKGPPEVVGAQGRFVVLLRAIIASGYYNKDEEEYFVYTGDPRSPSLESIPVPHDEDGRRLRVSEFGIVPGGGDAGRALPFLSYPAPSEAGRPWPRHRLAAAMPPAEGAAGPGISELLLLLSSRKTNPK